MRVPWEELSESPRKSEQLFHLLMHALYPGRVQTLNGAGGDGGCDAWIEDIRRAVEYKSFTKLGKKQREQVTRSLRRAAEKNPASWVLVAPVHPTPGDLQWFASLNGRYPSIEMIFHDVRWLERQLANHPDIARYLLTTPHQEVFDMLRELREEQAGLLGGAPDLRARVTALRQRVDELSPVWGMGFLSAGGHDSVFVHLKPDSPPQRVAVYLAADATADEDPKLTVLTDQLTAALHYGAGAVIEPGRIAHVDNDALAALNLPWEQVSMVLPDQRVTEGFPRPATLRAHDGETEVSSPLHLTLHHATVGARGMDVHGTDATGMLRLRLRIDLPDAHSPDQGSKVGMHLQYGPRDEQHAASVDPEALLRTVSVLDVLDHTPSMGLTLAGSTEQIVMDAGNREPTSHFTAELQRLRDLVLVRDRLSAPITLPARWARRDERNVAILAGLLRGEEVEMPFDNAVCHQISTRAEAQTLFDYLETGYGARLDFQMVGLVLPVAGVQVAVDPLYVVLSRARITNADEVVRALDRSEDEVPVDLAAAPGATLLGRRTPFPGPEGYAEPDETSPDVDR